MVRGSRRWSSRAALVVLAAVLLLSPAWGQSSLTQLRAEVASNPGSVSAWVALGNAYYEQGDLEQARESYLEAIALDYTSGDAHYGLGLAQFSRGDYQAALFEFTEVTRLYPERFDGQFNRAVTLARLRRPAEAAQAFLAALESGALSPGELMALPEDDVHALVAGVLGRVSTAEDEAGMATLLAAIERLPVDVGARLVRAYLAAVMEG